MRAPRADDYIVALLIKRNSDLAKHFKSDVIMIKSPIRFGLDDHIRHEVENLHNDEKKRPNRLTVILETTGGFIETVERIYNVFRKHYEIVDFIVPNYAYSAGTVLALSGDEIYMDYYSVLGPIDPQFETEDGRFVPGLGLLQKFEELTEYINSCDASQPQKYRAQLAYLLTKFNPGDLFHLEQARDHSISLLEEWLPRHKFKNWTKTNSHGRKVTERMRKDRAIQIAKLLSKPERWHSHGRGIGFRELTSDEIKLKVVNFGQHADLNEKIRHYYELLLDYCRKLRCADDRSTVIHTTNGLRRIYVQAQEN